MAFHGSNHGRPRQHAAANFVASVLEYGVDDIKKTFMKIEHIAIWVKDLESMKDFYCKYFNAVAGKKYINLKKKFESYFLSLRMVEDSS